MLSSMAKSMFSALAITISTLLFLFLTFVFVSSATKTSSDESQHPPIHIYDHATSACSGTLYPHLCLSTILTFQDLKCKSLPAIVSSTINHTLAQVNHSRSLIANYNIHNGLQLLDPRDRMAMDDCLELLDQTATQLQLSLSYLLSKKQHIPDAQAQLSAAMTNQYTCLDGFAHSNKQSIRNYLKGSLYNISRQVGNTLAMVTKIPGADNHSSLPSSEQLYGMTEDRFPLWLNNKDRKHLQSSSSNSFGQYDLIVAKDGSGNCTTINEAVGMVPNSSLTRFVIYIKAGEYYEYVNVTKKKMNIMFLGDGVGKTVIKGNRSVVDGWTTFRSATLGE